MACHANGRSRYIPPKIGRGLTIGKCWSVRTITTILFNYANDSDEKLTWEGYDAIAQTRDVQDYIENHDSENPFLLVLSWGPPHAPYETAPEKYRAMYRPEDVPCARMCHQNPKKMPENGLRDTTPIALRWTIVWAICSNAG